MTPRKDQTILSKAICRNRIAPGLIGVVLAVSGCVQVPEPSATQRLAAAPSPIGTPPSPDRKPANPPVQVAGALGELELQPEREPGSIIGLDEAGMRARFGEPQWIQEEPPGVRWQYGTPTCTVDVFFFMEVESQKLHVLSYDVTSQVDALQSEQQCLADVASKAGDQRG